MTQDRSRTVRSAPHRQRWLRYRISGQAEAVVDFDEAYDVPFEGVDPIRAFTYAREQRHTPGLYWSATCRRHLAYESYLESRWLLIYDQDPDVTAMATQPFQMLAIDPTAEDWQRYPDFFLRHRNGAATVIDVKRQRDADREDVQRVMARTADACADIGWGYRLVTEPGRQRLTNIEWLAGYRRPLDDRGLAATLLHAAHTPSTIHDLTTGTDQPELARAVLFHLMWQGQILADLDRPLRNDSWIRLAPTAGGPA